MSENSSAAIIIVGVSGSGKSVSLELIKQSCTDIFIFPKHTTRAKRTGEKEGVQYHFISNEEFQEAIDRNIFIHIKKSDYDQNLYGISKIELKKCLMQNKIPCFTAHSIEEIIDVKKELNKLSIIFYTIYVYASEDNRTEHLLQSDQKEKLIVRYHTDIGFKLHAFQSLFDECDFVILNEDDITSLKRKLNKIGTWIKDPSRYDKPQKIQHKDLLTIKNDIDEIASDTSKYIGLSNENLVSHITDSMLAEYSVLREEIKQYHSDRTNYVNFAVGLTIGLLVLISSKDVTASYRSIILVVSPFIYCILSFLYIDKSFRIIRLADYIENSLRLRLENLLNHSIFQWEKYKRETDIFPKWVAKLLDRIRLFIFIGPAIAAIASWFLLYYTTTLGIEHSLGIAGSLVIILVLLLNQFTQETTGARRKTKSEKIKKGDRYGK